MLMFLAFLIDQAQQRCCGLFQEALKARKKKMYLWNLLRSFFLEYYIDSWADMFAAMVKKKDARLKDLLDTS
jgi:hypothetical protein